MEGRLGCKCTTWVMSRCMCANIMNTLFQISEHRSRRPFFRLDSYGDNVMLLMNTSIGAIYGVGRARGHDPIAFWVPGNVWVCVYTWFNIATYYRTFFHTKLTKAWPRNFNILCQCKWYIFVLTYSAVFFTITRRGILEEGGGEEERELGPLRSATFKPTLRPWTPRSVFTDYW